MAKRRKVNNLLALAVMTALAERPMHPYEIATVLRERGKEQSMKINWGSLYTVVENLGKHGFIETAGTTRQGRRPERTVYAITPSGREELTDWLRELVGTLEREYPRFEAGLAELGALGPDEVIGLLNQRASALEAEIAAEQATLRQASREIPRLFLIESEYRLAMRKAEAKWVNSVLKELEDGSMPGVAQWRRFYETGEMPPEFAELTKRGSVEN